MWDDFLLNNPGGYYTQSSLWGQAKSVLGWHPVRIIVSQDERIVAGVQVLIRFLPIGGTIGYAAGGPLIAFEDPSFSEVLMAELEQVTKRFHIQYLFVQPYAKNAVLERELLKADYQASSRSAIANFTALLDLTQDQDSILSAMRKSTRHNIRIAIRKGVTIREGRECDLPIFYRLLTATYQRLNLPIFPEEYFASLWRILHARGYLHLFIAEFMGEDIAASQVISFGDMVIDSFGAWSGQHKKAHPNELLEWATISWAKSQGYHYFDFDGITPVNSGEELFGGIKQDGVSFFKLGFGGKTVPGPVAYEYLPNPLLRWAYRHIGQRLTSPQRLMSLEFVLRGMSSASIKSHAL
jgi:peptidoglycan pentaglycine glycine transferase (the first glycine)